ncbi:MAG: endonuclease III domain-containing protein [Syntrophobacter sp.]
MSGNSRDLLESIYHRLYETLGPQHWWPAETPFEVILGAILTQNAAWKNVARAISNLREYNMLGFGAVCDIPAQSLAFLIRPSGFYNQKTAKIKAFCQHVLSQWDGDLDGFLAQDAEVLRGELLRIRGIGPETADSIILYAALKPTFVVDSYTFRIFSRHGWVGEPLEYDELRDFFVRSLEPDVQLYKEYHALLVRTGNLFCRKKPLCASCPLNVFFEGQSHP